MVASAGGGATLLAPDVVEAYLDRIGHGPAGPPTSATLANLQDAHVRHVPFENLDIHLGQALSLEIDDLATKVIQRRRGGFCYELNGLFGALLASLGFTVRFVQARSPTEDGLGPRFDHVRILVDLDHHWLLVDVGTGVSPRGPIQLDGGPQRIGGHLYRVRNRAGRYVTEQLRDDAWTPDWSFDTTPRVLGDFIERCRFHERSSDSHFARKPICTLVTADGHLSLTDRQFTVVSGQRRHHEQVDDPLAVLAERFGIAIPRWPGTPSPDDRTIRD